MRRVLLWLFAVGLCVAPSRNARADTLAVGPKGKYAAPCAAFAAAVDGDTIEIDSRGAYVGDVCGIAKSKLTIRGMGGLAKVDAGGKNAQGKATWVVQGDDTTIESIEFTGAAVPDMNGAGIRQEGKNLTVRRCFFHDNENGILAGDSAGSQILIENSEFDHNGAGDGQSHNLYINHVDRLTFRYNWSHRSVIGHLLKSRAAESYVIANRITGEADGTSSYELDFPNGGKTYVIGNLIEQGPKTDNSSILAYIEEGADAKNPSHQLYVVNNTFMNDNGGSGTFLNIAKDAAPAVVTNNVFFGGGTPSSQASSVLSHNYTDTTPCLVDFVAFDYHLLPKSPCVDAGVAPGVGDGFPLLPDTQYVHPASSTGRVSVGTVDIGAYELGGETAPVGGSANAGGTSGGGASGGNASGSASGGSTSGGGASAGHSQAGGNPGSDTGGESAGSSGSSNDTKTSAGCGCRVERSHNATHYGLIVALLLGAVRRRRSAAHGQ
jgi:Right handed beta helix region